MADYLDCAYEVLEEVYKKGAFSQIALNETLENNRGLNNISLVAKIVYGVLENDIFLEYAVMQFVDKKPKNSVLLLLKIGCYFIKFLDNMPDYAAVHKLVSFSKKVGKSGVSGFLNATLKKICTEEIVLPKNISERFSVQYSYPLWYVGRIVAQYGEPLAEEILQYRGKGKTSVRCNRRLISCEDFERLMQSKHVSYEKTGVEGVYYVSHSTMKNAEIPQKYYVNQGVSSVLTCKAMDVAPNWSILDVCAAPGGKSVYLSELCPKGSVLACDLHPHRVELIKKYAARMCADNVQAAVNDAVKFRADFENRFDAVLCDVPCSGFGVVQDKPDIKFHREESGIAGLSAVQGEILETCSRYVKSGGVLMYSTCTILREENSDVVEGFLKRHKNFVAEDIFLEIQPQMRIGKFVQLLPCLDGVQGFFMAKLRRIGDD